MSIFARFNFEKTMASRTCYEKIIPMKNHFGTNEWKKELIENIRETYKFLPDVSIKLYLNHETEHTLIVVEREGVKFIFSAQESVTEPC